MIQITRAEKPTVLVRNEIKWLAAYMAAIQAFQQSPVAGNKKKKDTAERKYNHKSVKEALKVMFSGKCAFCESHVIHVDYGAIEHFRPKSKFPELCFSWNNYLLCCNICNGAGQKGDRFPEVAEDGPFINPTEENPDDFFTFEFDPKTGTANVLPKNKRAAITETIIGLNRPDLVKYRSSIVRMMVVIALKASQGDTDCRNEIKRLCQNNTNYAAFARTLVSRFNL